MLAGAISRWLWRTWVQRLTPPGRWLVLASAIFVTYGGASLQLQGFVLGAYAGALWLVAMLAMLLYRPRVRLTARHAERCSAGEALPVDIEIEQRGRLGGGDLLVLAHRLPLEIDAVPDAGMMLPDLRRGQRHRLQMRLRCNRRGRYVLRGWRVETQFPFGMLRARRIFAEQRPLLVYPTFTALARLLLPTGRRYQPGGVALASNLGESFEFLGNRDWRDGDNVRDIDWRATARVQKPIVREYREEYFLRVAVILDTHLPASIRASSRPRRRDDLERAVSLAAAVSDYMARQDYLVDLFAAGPNLYHLTAGRSLAYLDQILDILACVEESADEPFEVIEPQIAELMNRISTVICVLLDWNDTRRAFVHDLRRQGAAVKVIILRDGACTIDPSIDADVLGEIPVISPDDFARGVEEL
jgi:uncharacterized protein (DUF58 family)